MILTDNETIVDLLNNEVIAVTIIGLLREHLDIYKLGREAGTARTRRFEGGL